MSRGAASEPVGETSRPGGRSKGPGEQGTPSRPRPSRSGAEWVTFAVASAILLAVVAAIASLWASGPPEPASFVVRTLPARQAEGGYYVRATVENRGDETAEGVQVVAELTMSGTVAEEGEQAIDFVSGGESEEVEFVFTEDPAEGEVEVTVRSYKVR